MLELTSHGGQDKEMGFNKSMLSHSIVFWGHGEIGLGDLIL